MNLQSEIDAGTQFSLPVQIIKIIGTYVGAVLVCTLDVRPCHVATSRDGLLWVAHDHGQVLSAFRLSSDKSIGSLVHSITSDVHRFDGPIAINSRNEIVVCLRSSICTFDSQGILLRSFSQQSPHEGRTVMALDKHDQLYLDDASERRVNVYSREGEYLRHIKLCTFPAFLAVSPVNSNLFVGIAYDEFATHIYDASGKWLRPLLCSNDASDKLPFPMHVYGRTAFDSVGNVYVSTSKSIRVFSPNDTLLTEIPCTADFGFKLDNYPDRTLAVDTAGRLVISDGCAVLVFSL